MAEAKKGNMTQEEKMQKQYDRLIAARNYHYDNLNKWLMSFYVIIGALFVAIYNLHGKASFELMELVVAIVGYVVSLAALLSGKGYYYWETNWIMLIHHFEKIYLKDLPLDQRVYSVFANEKFNNNINNPLMGANISTTKVALALTNFIAILWGTITIFVGIYLAPCACLKELWCELLISVFSLCVSYLMTPVLVRIGAKKIESYMKPLDDLELTEDNIDKPLKKKIKKNEVD